MKQNFINEVHLEGYLYSQDLKKRLSGPKSKNPGTPFFNGEISIAVDEDCLNVIKIHFSYVTAKTKSGQSNRTYQILEDIGYVDATGDTEEKVKGKLKNVMDDGKDAATKLAFNGALALNEFYSRNNPETLISVKRNEGGFLDIKTSIDPEEKNRNQFKVDFVITGTYRTEEDEEKNIPEKVHVRGGFFNFKKELCPTEFTALNSAAMDYFEGLEASPANPVFTKIWGHQISETVVREVREEGAFGEDSIRTFTNTHKDYIITGASKEPYEFDDESTLTKDELKQMMAEREIYTSALKTSSEEYRKNAQAAAPTSSAGDFTF